MKACPSCGYRPLPGNGTLGKLYKKHFGEIPVLAMIQRQWINPFRRDDVADVEKELISFFELNDREQLQKFIKGDFEPAWLEKVMVCRSPVTDIDFERGQL